jgi:hypothetical protein
MGHVSGKSSYVGVSLGARPGKVGRGALGGGRLGANPHVHAIPEGVAASPHA